MVCFSSFIKLLFSSPKFHAIFFSLLNITYGPTHLRKVKPEEKKDNQGYNCNFWLNMGEEGLRKGNWFHLGGVHTERTSSSKYLVGHTGVKRCPSISRTVRGSSSFWMSWERQNAGIVLGFFAGLVWWGTDRELSSTQVILALSYLRLIWGMVLNMP